MCRAEHRITEAERPPPFGTDASSGGSYVPIDRVPSYTIEDSALDRGVSW